MRTRWLYLPEHEYRPVLRSGRHAIRLAQRGYAMTGLDLSTYDIELARNASELGRNSRRLIAIAEKV